jgi:hypothetical protein
MGFLKLLYGAEMRENSEKYPCTFNDGQGGKFCVKVNSERIKNR